MLLILLMGCCLPQISGAFILSGVVVNASTGKGVAGQKVYVMDTATNFQDSIVSNASGGYSLQILGGVDTNDLLEVYTYGCGKKSSVFKTFTGGTVVANLYICPTLYSLNGTVSLNGSLNNGPAKLFLLSRTYDSLHHDSVTHVVDTIYTDSYGGTFNKNFTSIPQGNLLLKAELMEGHPQYGKFMPTWLGEDLVWSNSKSLTTSNFSASVATNIYLLPTAGSSGTAAASGIVVNANTGTTLPLSGRLILLTNSTGTPLGYQYSDSLGKFAFAHLAFGTYKIFGDSWGRLNPALTFTLTAIRTSITDIVFTEDSSSFSGNFSATFVATNPEAWTQVKLYPNPVAQQLFISGLDKIDGSKTIFLRDIMGRTMLRQLATNEPEINLNLTALPTGIFVAEIQAASGLVRYQIIKL